MKTHDFAKQLEAFAKTIRALPNVEVDNILKALIDIAKIDSNTIQKDPHNDSREMPEGIEEKIRNMTSTEVEDYLAKEIDVFNSANLLKLASRLGIPTSKRQSRNALINLITKHFEAGQMDSMIRGVHRERS
jgi:hypothetical protein